MRLLLSDSGRGFGVFCRFWASESGFLMVEVGRDTTGVLLGVAVGAATLALTVLLPGTVMESLFDAAPNRFGVAGKGWGGPSLVVGLLLLLDKAEAGRKGGPMEVSALKKLDLRRVLLAAGDEGSCARLSTVLSESDGRDFFFRDVCDSGECSDTSSDADSSALSRKPALESALEEAREADLKPSRLPNVSSSLVVLDDRVD